MGLYGPMTLEFLQLGLVSAEETTYLVVSLKNAAPGLGFELDSLYVIPAPATPS